MDKETVKRLADKFSARIPKEILSTNIDLEIFSEQKLLAFAQACCDWQKEQIINSHAFFQSQEGGWLADSIRNTKTQPRD